MRASLSDDGTIRAMEVKTGSEWEAVEFRRGPFAGPAWAGVKMQRREGSASSFVAAVDGIRYSLDYRIDGNRLAIVAGLKNEAHSELRSEGRYAGAGRRQRDVVLSKMELSLFPHPVAL